MQHARYFDCDADQVMKAAEDGDDDEEYWMELEGLYVEADEHEVEATIPKRHNPQRMAKRRDALITIVCNFLITNNYAIHKESQKKVVIISIMMQSTNQKCNALESVFGIFLHSTNTPEKVISALAHMGLSISVDAINKAVHLLSHETFHTLRAMGRSLLVAYAYDNFDIDFRRSVPTIEKTGDTLEHLTSGDLIMLEHGVTLEDLRCSDELWQKSPLNPKVPQDGLSPPHTCADLLTLHPETDHPSGLTRRERFNAWKFRQDMVHYGPVYLRRFIKDLGEPEAIDQIPVVKMRHTPARSMDINQSKVSGNISVIPELLQQGGVGDPAEELRLGEYLSSQETDTVDITKFVALFFGDLETFERVQSLLQRRSLEETPWRRYQYVVFVMGLFHLKMACADAIWRIFIHPHTARDGVNSLMHFVALNRPREMGKIASNPKFQQMHEVIGHNGAALRLYCWRVEVAERNPVWSSLESFAMSRPNFKDIEDMSNQLVVNYVGGGATTTSSISVASQLHLVINKEKICY